MANKFHERFKIDVGLDEARRRFVNRVQNFIFEDFLERPEYENVRYQIERDILTILGDRVPSSEYMPKSFTQRLGSGYYRNLQAVEALWSLLLEGADRRHRDAINDLVDAILGLSEIDLAISWRDGSFVPTGAKLLDEALVNDPLDFLRNARLESVVAPFEKALRHLLEARKEPHLLADAVTDAYEAVEAMAKVTTERDRDLSANRELFLQKIGASQEYKALLKDYIDYACRFRHAASPNEAKPSISYKEAESFVYLTGLFLRLAMPESRNEGNGQP